MANLYSIPRNYKDLAKLFAHGIEGIVNVLHTPGMQELLTSQQMFYKKFYSWENRKHEWTNFLQGALNGKS